jgi:hypothetical protein
MDHQPFSCNAAKHLSTFVRLIFFSVTLLVAGSAIAQPIYENYTITTLAGPGNSGPGWDDGLTNVARFGSPSAVAQDNAGNIYVADRQNHTIRKITPAGIVSTVAGSTGLAGSADGIGAAARFNSPNGIAVDSNGNFFVADSGNHTIRKITPNGAVTTFAGLAGVSGSANGPGSTARFFAPFGVMVDPNDTIYVADTLNNTIRMITPAGVVSTLAGKAGVTGSQDKNGTAATFNNPISLAMDSSGNIYVADSANHLIRKIAPNAAVTTLAGSPGVPGSADGTNDTARFNSPFGVAVDSSDNIYVADTSNDAIRKISLSGVVTTVAGVAGVAGSVDGIGDQARLSSPTGLTAGHGTDLVVADFSNSTIRRVLGGNNVTTLAGTAGGPGSQNGNASAARFNSPAGAALDAAGNIYVADEQNHAIRKISPSGDVSTFAGTLGVAGSNDDAGVNARFNRPLGVAFDGAGNLYVADSRNHTIRKITPDGAVGTLAGLAGVLGTNDGVGSNARFNTPFSVAVDAQTNVYVADTFNNTIRKITPDGMVSTLAGQAGISGTNNGTGSQATFSVPEGIAVDPDGNVFVTDDANSAIRKITPDGVVTTFAGQVAHAGTSDGTSTARFNFPFGLAIDGNRNLYVADTGSATIRKVTPAGAVTTLVGLAGVFGNVDATGNDARMRSPQGIAVDAAGTLYISDRDNHTIRKAYPALPDMPTVDFAAARVGVTRHFGITNQTTTSWQWSFIRYPAASSAQFSSPTAANPTLTPDVEDSYLVRFQGTDNSGRTTIRTLTLYSDNTSPSVAITNPVSGQISSNGVFTVRGTATDNFGVSNVWVQINGGAWTRAVGTTSWSADVTPINGTNFVSAYAEDLAGNVSQTNTVDFRYGAPLTVILHGGGTVTPDLNGQLLEIGKTYSITAQAGAGCSFVNWTGSLTTDSPTLTFVMDTNLTFTANFTDPIRPKLVITSPTKGFHVSNAVFTATGTATDNGQLAAVWYRLNKGNWIQATNTSNWTAGLALSGSANTLEAYAVDTFANISTTNSMAFTYIPSGKIAVTLTGQGTLTPNYNGWFLQIGKSYTMTAKPIFNSIFSKWTDSNGNTITTTPSFKFTVQGDMAVRANFVTNPFGLTSGPYSGLFYDTNNIETTNSGSISLTLTSAGSFSSKIQLTSGKKISASGRFTTDGVFSNSIAVKGSAPLILQLALSSSTTQVQINGSISGAGWTSPLTAVRAIFSPANPAPQAGKKFTLVISGGDDSTVRPAGNGFGTLTVDISGNLNLSAVLADGVSVKLKTLVDRQGVWPLYSAPYKGQGAIFGWMSFVTNQINTDVTGTLYWFRHPQSSAKVYPGGFNFPGGISADGSLYSITNGVPLLNLPSGGVSVLQLGNPLQSYTNNFTMAANNQITSADGLKAKITTGSGLFSGTAISLGNGTSVTISGVLLQKQNSGYGFFLSNGQSGAVYLGP